MKAQLLSDSVHSDTSTALKGISVPTWSRLTTTMKSVMDGW